MTWVDNKQAKYERDNKMRPLFRYTSEVRLFEDDGMDYISIQFSDNNFDALLKATRKYARQLGGKIKINILENRSLYETPSIYSKTSTFK